MKTLLFALLGLVASIYLADSLTCNKCSFGLGGICISSFSFSSSSTETCVGNDTSCFTGKASFPSVFDITIFNTQGCLATSSCADVSNGTILGVAYEVAYTCCSTDTCNPIEIDPLISI